MKSERFESLNAAEAILKTADAANRKLTTEEQKIFDSHMALVTGLNTKIEHSESVNTISTMFNGSGLGSRIETSRGTVVPGEHPRAMEYRAQFAAWMNNAVASIGGLPQMEATAPSGPVSVGTSGGWDSIGTTVPFEVLPYLPSYFNLDSFGLAGATQIFTDHTRPLFKPVISAGAADCQGRLKRRPVRRSKREPVGRTARQGFSGEKGLWSVAEEALLPRSAFGGGGFSGLEARAVFGGFA
jgi:hypothetical protein